MFIKEKTSNLEYFSINGKHYFKKVYIQKKNQLFKIYFKTTNNKENFFDGYFLN